MNEKKIKFKKIGLILLLTILSSLPVFFARNAIIQGHDTYFHLSRIRALSENIQIGKMLPVYYNYLNHLGYGNGLFYPDLFLYIPAFLYGIGVNLITSYKIFVILINLFSLLTIYLCINKITKDKSCSNIGMILYAFSLYRFTDMFERGALGESLAFIFIPLIILGLYKIFYDDYKEGFYLMIGLSGVLLSHLISAYILVVFTILFSAMNLKRLKDKHRLATLIICIICSMLVTSCFWVPLFEQLLFDDFHLGTNISIFENCVPFIALFMDFPLVMFDGWLPPGIGVAYFISIYLYFKSKIKDEFLSNIYVIGIISIILSCLTCIWKFGFFYKVFSIIQFPWRFYLLATCLFTIGISIIYKYNKNRKIINLLLIYSFLFFSLNCFLSYFDIYINGDLSEYSIMFGEYLPKEIGIIKNEYVYDSDEVKISQFQNKYISGAGIIKISELDNKYVYDEYHLDSNISYNYIQEKTIVDILENVDKIEVPLIYYKGYVARDENKYYNVSKSENGLVEVDIDDNTTKIEVYYEGTSASKVSKVISVLGVVIAMIYVYNVRKKYEKSKI